MVSDIGRVLNKRHLKFVMELLPKYYRATYDWEKYNDSCYKRGYCYKIKMIFEDHNIHMLGEMMGLITGIRMTLEKMEKSNA
jgi:hypothetical protein